MLCLRLLIFNIWLMWNFTAVNSKQRSWGKRHWCCWRWSFQPASCLHGFAGFLSRSTEILKRFIRRVSEPFTFFLHQQFCTGNGSQLKVSFSLYHNFFDLSVYTIARQSWCTLQSLFTLTSMAITVSHMLLTFVFAFLTTQSFWKKRCTRDCITIKTIE